MRNASEISSRLGDVSAELRQKLVTGEAGGGMVVVECNGLGQAIRVTIDIALFESNDVEMIQTLLPAAINQATSRAKQLHVDAMKELTGGISLPGMDDIIEQYTGGGDTPHPP
jgi:DNA-binding YbaB/EbfC family protein